MAQGIFLHKYDVDGKLYDGDVTTLNNKLQSGAEVDAKITALSLDTMSTQAADSVNISGGAIAGITDLAVADGGTGASSASAARTNLGVAIGSDVQAYGAKLDALSALAATDSGFIVGNGSTFVLETGATARTSLGVDAAGTDNSTDVTLAGKDFASISGQEITFAQIDLTDDVTGALPIANGGSGATTASAARTALGLAISTDVQAYDAELAALAGLTSAANKIPMFNGSESATVIDFLDEDGLSSNSATAVPSQQSVKAFVEAQVQGLDIKDSVRLASTANVAGSYSSGVLTVTSAGVLTIDGGNVAINNRVLLKDQTTGTQNGIYKCTTAGEAASGTSPNTSSPSTLDDAQYGSSSTLSNIQMTSATLSSSSTFIEYASYTGSSFTPPANGVMILSDGSDTIAFNLSGYPSSLNSSGSWPIESSPNNYNATYSSVTSLSVDSSTTVAFRSRTVAPLFSLGNGSAMTSSSSSFALSSGWGGSTISAGHYIEYQNYASNKWYWRIESDLENGDTSISVAFDSDDSYSSSPTGAYFSSSSTLALFAGQSGGSAVAAVLTRADDFDSDADITAGAFCFVEEGTASADAGFVLSTNEPITLDTTALAFSQFSGAGSITAGTGLTKSGNTIAATGGLADIAGLAKTDGGIIVGDGSNFVLESGATARTSLGVDAAGTDNSTDVTLASVSSNYLSISGQEITAGNVPVTLGGTGAASASAARSNLGVDVAGTDNSTDVTLASVSGNYLSISGQEVTAGTVPVALGGTGATSASAARTALGLAIGSDTQAHSDILDDIAGVTQAADKGVYFDGSSTAATFDLTSAGRALLDDADAAAMRSTLGLVIGTDVAAADSSELSVNTSEPTSIAIANINGMFVYDLSGSSTSAAVTLPSTATSGCLGKSVIFKIKGAVGSGSSFTINPASSQTIDGESSIVLNQERQSIRLVVSEEYSSGAAVQCWVVV